MGMSRCFAFELENKVNYDYSPYWGSFAVVEGEQGRKVVSAWSHLRINTPDWSFLSPMSRLWSVGFMLHMIRCETERKFIAEHLAWAWGVNWWKGTWTLSARVFLIYRSPESHYSVPPIWLSLPNPTVFIGINKKEELVKGMQNTQVWTSDSFFLDKNSYTAN